MDRTTSTETKQIPRQRWEGWCDTFTNGNRGRAVTIELVDDGMGAAPLAEGIALVAIDYDTPGKGNDIVVSYGDEATPSRHTISAPAKLLQTQDENGAVASLEIEDEGGRRTIVSF